ncbi:hypothetical protein BDV10DRAFT_181795 [Aspergillus recurvatus]
MSRRRGRRILLLVSLGGIFFTIIAIGSFFFIDDDDVRLGLVSFFTIIIFLFFYGIGAGPVPFTFSAEVFPLAFREVGMSFSVMVNFLGLGLLVLLVPFITSEFGLYGNSYLLYLFGGLDLLAFVLVFLFVPSTGRIPLENMDHVFNQKMSEQVQEHLRVFRAGRRNESDTQGDIPMDRLSRRSSRSQCL